MLLAISEPQLRMLSRHRLTGALLLVRGNLANRVRIAAAAAADANRTRSDVRDDPPYLLHSFDIRRSPARNLPLRLIMVSVRTLPSIARTSE
jgi:hypothetical protein